MASLAKLQQRELYTSPFIDRNLCSDSGSDDLDISTSPVHNKPKWWLRSESDQTINSSDHEVLEASFSSSSPSPEVLKSNLLCSPQCPSHATGWEVYEDDIYWWNREMELRFHPVSCLFRQEQVNKVHRSNVIVWLSRLNDFFKFHRETLYLAVNLMDRFLITTPIFLTNLQLLSITALLVASKLTEIHPIEVPEMMSLCEDRYRAQEFLRMELTLLHKLKFSLWAPTIEVFLEYHLGRRNDWPSEWHKQYVNDYAKNISDIVLLHYDLSQWPPSLIAVAAFAIAVERAEGRNWTTVQFINSFSGYQAFTINSCIEDILIVLQKHQNWNPDLIY